MVIALERYLIPKILKDQETSYSSAFIRICTSLTKDWFRQFAIDNYLRLSNLDKDLLSIPIYACTSRIYDLDTPSISQGMQLETYRSGIKITSPVNKNISIAAIITTVYMVDFEDCNPGSDYDEYDRETYGSYYDSLHHHPFDHNIIGNPHTLEIGSKTSGDSWSVAEDIWYLPKIRAKSADHQQKVELSVLSRNE
ncbi:1794_t:CDS:2 [Rhizophagus irregularis]|nr:1794_t:CDS:2 [Rhizophagus irregularis]